MKQGWFSTTKEAIYEQRQLVVILEHAGVNVLDVVGDSAEFSFNAGRALIEKSAKLAYKNKLHVAKGFPRQKDFINKMLGNWMEYQFDAVINSRRFSTLLPSRWVKSVHRSEYGIQDMERGSPDRIVLDNEGKFNALISIKLHGDIKKSPENLDTIFSWSVTKSHKYKLGHAPNTIPDCGLYTNASSGKDLDWPGGKVCYGLKGNTVYDILDNSAAATNWWRDFFAELKYNIDSVSVASAIKTIYKTPDEFQFEQVVDVVEKHVGAGIVNAACGFGKTVCQIATIPRTRSINVYMAGGRLALAGQANNEFDLCLGVESHRLYVMSLQEFQKRVDSNIRAELSVNANSANSIAVCIVDYALGSDNRPFIILTIEQSINKVFAALELIKNGKVVDETGNLYDWCTVPSLVNSVWQSVLAVLGVAHYDEAHNLVTGCGSSVDNDEPKRKPKTQNYIKWTNTLFKKSIFWTATVVKNKVDAGYDMRNEEVFGKVIAVVHPGTAIAHGYTVPPKLVPVRLPEGAIYAAGIKGDTDADLELTYYIKSIENAYFRLKNEGQPCQLLVFTSNVSYHETFKQKLYDHFKQLDPKFWCNFVEADTDAITRQQYFKEFSNSKFSVLLNYNIVAEGIDIASCTGVVIGRSMVDKTYVQVAGRPCRLSTEDRTDIKSGVLEAGAWSTYRKKYGLVYVFVDESDADSVSDGAQLYALVEAMLKSNNHSAWWIESAAGQGLTGRKQEDLTKIDKMKPEVDAIFDIAVASQMVVSEETTLLIAAKLIEAERKAKAAEELAKLNELFDFNS